MMKFFSLRHTDVPYHTVFGNQDVMGFGVYNQNETIGKVVDVLTDEMERSYYVAVERNHLFSQERFILPLTACKLSTSEQRIYVVEMNKTQIKNLPAYRRENVTSYSNKHTSGATAVNQREPLPVEASLPLEYSVPLEARVVSANVPMYGSVTESEITDNTRPVPMPEDSIQTETPLAVTPTPIEARAVEANPIPVQRQVNYIPGDVVKQHNIQLLAERLVVDRKRRKVGEVVVRKVVETQMVSVPVRRERLIVEQVSPERKSLAAIDLDRGELSQEELRRLIPGASDDSIQTVTNRMGMQTALPTETVSIQTAIQILQQVNQVAQFKHAAVKLVFDDEDLQKRYQRWLADHK
jgi:stress response protein YsnF